MYHWLQIHANHLLPLATALGRPKVSYGAAGHDQWRIAFRETPKPLLRLGVAVLNGTLT